MAKSARGQGWAGLVKSVVERLPEYFDLADVLQFHDFFAEHYPDNQFIDAKVRQSLQILRDRGAIQFLGKGRYQKTTGNDAFSPFYDPSVAEGYVSKSQIARVTIETWAEHNLYCCNCKNDDLTGLPTNEPVADLRCHVCQTSYQLKSKDGRFGGSIMGAAYRPTIEALRRGEMPTLVLLEYDPRVKMVVFVSAIPGPQIDADRVVARKPLAESAKRSGWQGCNIHIAGLPRIEIVRPAHLPTEDVRREWKRVVRNRA